jgi:putative serine protease PepD
LARQGRGQTVNRVTTPERDPLDVEHTPDAEADEAEARTTEPSATQPDGPDEAAPVADTLGEAPASEDAPDDTDGPGETEAAEGDAAADPVVAWPTTWADGDLPNPPAAGPQLSTCLPEYDERATRARRSRRLRHVGAATVAIGVLTLASLAGYETGRAQWSPPATVTTVQAAPENFAAQSVFKSVSSSIVQVSVAGGGTGSGFFYGPNRIATNAHVINTSPDAIAHATTPSKLRATVVLADGRVKEAKVVAMDLRLDLAILSVEPGLGVEPLGFAKSSVYTTPGTGVAVVGYPFGGPQTITTGVLSAVVTNSQFAESDVQAVLLQTDAAVNPGNSGGPLLDATGAVLGIVTLRPDDVNDRPSAGVAMALAGDQVKQALTELEEYGQVRPPRIGIELGTAESGSKSARGAAVKLVVEDSPADGAGLRVGDVITEIDGRAVTDSAGLIKALVGRSAGEIISLTVLTDGKSREVSLKLATR